MTNFTYLTSTPDFASFSGVAESAERLFHIDPRCLRLQLPQDDGVGLEQG